MFHKTSNMKSNATKINEGRKHTNGVIPLRSAGSLNPTLDLGKLTAVMCLGP